MTLLEELQRAGWDPFDPSPECRRLTARPVMDLSPLDGKGVHWRIVTLRVFSKFGKGDSWRGDRGLRLMKCASLFVLAETYPGPEQNPEEAAKLYQELDRWHHDILLPCSDRMLEAFKTKGPEYVRNHRREFEPSVTLTLLEEQLGLIDRDRDQRLLGLGLAMHDQGTLTPKHSKAATLEHLVAYQEFLTRDGDSIARISPDGKITVDPKRVKTAVDSFGREDAPKDQGEVDEAPEPADPMSALAAVIAVEDVRRVDEARGKRLAEVPEGGASWHVLIHLHELLDGEMSQVELVEVSGLAASTINEAFKAEARAILGLLQAA
jgi:hypothetical protein